MRRMGIATMLVVGVLTATGWTAAASAQAKPINEIGQDGLAKGYTLLATPKGVISGYFSPDGRKVRNLSPTWQGEPLTMPVRSIRDGYYDVRLPGRPNDSTIWVKKSQVIVGESAYQILINLQTTHLQLIYKGRTILNAPVGVGTNQDPTPTGRFFVAFYAQPSSSGYGPFVMVTSAHSNTITDWEDSGDAMVAIHGPLGAGRTIGRHGARVSHGCIRMHLNDQIKLRNVPVGSPVIIIS